MTLPEKIEYPPNNNTNQNIELYEKKKLLLSQNNPNLLYNSSPQDKVLIKYQIFQQIIFKIYLSIAYKINIILNLQNFFLPKSNLKRAKII